MATKCGPQREIDEATEALDITKPETFERLQLALQKYGSASARGIIDRLKTQLCRMADPEAFQQWQKHIATAKENDLKTLADEAEKLRQQAEAKAHDVYKGKLADLFAQKPPSNDLPHFVIADKPEAPAQVLEWMSMYGKERSQSLHELTNSRWARRFQGLFNGEPEMVLEYKGNDVNYLIQPIYKSTWDWIQSTAKRGIETGQTASAYLPSSKEKSNATNS